MFSPEFLTTLGAAGVTLGAMVYGFVQKYQRDRALLAQRVAQDSNKIIDIKNELIEVQKERAETWRTKYEAEHAEYVEYRAESHEQGRKASELVLRYSAENGELRAKTDLSPILEHQKEDRVISLKMIETLGAISSTQAKISEAQDKILMWLSAEMRQRAPEK